ncbi:MAG: hypothetical protein JWM86_2900 [Thermoleophilia bacterium]|nr:hypothetical protein [Thermoleophilia bacterium]
MAARDIGGTTMKITPALGIALGLGVGGAVGAGIALHGALTNDDEGGGTPVGHGPHPVPSPEPGPAPKPPNDDVQLDDPPTGPQRPTDTQSWPETHKNYVEFPKIDGMVDRYMKAYDHSHDGVIQLGSGQEFGTDERITGDVGTLHTMVEFFRDSDANGDSRLTRAELKGGITGFDEKTLDTYGPPLPGQTMPKVGDGRLNPDELDRFRQGAIRDHSDPSQHWTDRGVEQILSVDGEHVNNEQFFRSLPEYRALD